MFGYWYKYAYVYAYIGTPKYTYIYKYICANVCTSIHPYMDINTDWYRFKNISILYFALKGLSSKSFTVLLHW